VVAALATGENLLQKVQALKPRVVLLDLGLRSQNSLRLVQLITNQCPDIKTIVMDFLPSQTDVVEFVQAGVSGFLLKEASFDEFLKTIRLVAEGANILPQSLAGSLFSEIVAHAVATRKPLLISSVRLTRREREIVVLIADGLSNKEIAQRLNLATFTVKSHVHNILEKLALHTRVQVASYYGQTRPVPDEAHLHRN
jgi:DNA-binding NarL/FixJ family response regulator